MSDSLADRWVYADAERKLRRKEKKIAWLMAFRAGVEESENGLYCPDTDDATSALESARSASSAYEVAWRRAAGLKGALTRRAQRTPEPNSALWARYEALCAHERIAAESDIPFAEMPKLRLA